MLKSPSTNTTLAILTQLEKKLLFNSGLVSGALGVLQPVLNPVLGLVKELLSTLTGEELGVCGDPQLAILVNAYFELQGKNDFISKLLSGTLLNAILKARNSLANAMPVRLL